MTPAEADRGRGLALLRALVDDLDHVPGEVLVKFHAGVEASTQSAVLGLAPTPAGGRRTRWVGDLAVVSIDEAAPAAVVASRLAREPEVEYAQPNYLARIRATPNDPGFSRQWNLSAIEATRAWDINPGATDVLVAVVDSGVTTQTIVSTYRLWNGARFELVPIPYRVNPDLDSGRILTGIETSSIRLFNPSLTTQPVFDSQGHGTHVAGTVLQATNNTLGFAGVAYAARLLAVKSCISFWDIQFYLGALGEPGFADPDLDGACITSDVIAGVRAAADAGAKVINLSLGGPGPSPAYADAVRYAVQRGAFVAIAMGNEYEDGNPTSFPAAYAPDIEGAMAVGAVGRSLRRAYYSNTGTHVEIAAPGGDVRDGGLPGVIYQTGLFDPDFDPFSGFFPRFDRYADSAKQGTSMAAPHVAGLAALIYAQGITSPAAIEAAIKQFARDLGDPGHDPQYGAGLVDARATLRGLGVAR
jgi:serine protease